MHLSNRLPETRLFGQPCTQLAVLYLSYPSATCLTRRKIIHVILSLFLWDSTSPFNTPSSDRASGGRAPALSCFTYCKRITPTPSPRVAAKLWISEVVETSSNPSNRNTLDTRSRSSSLIPHRYARSLMLPSVRRLSSSFAI